MGQSEKATKKYGQLSKLDITKEMKTKGGLSIISCYNISDNMNFSSIDITPTIVCLSVKTGMLQKIYVKKSQCVNSYYVYVNPHDTLLIVSNEYISMPYYISGYVTSRVSNVASGFGHISTTIDPNWDGALLIGLNNPTKRAIKIEVGTSTDASKNKDDKNSYMPPKKPLATVTFHYLSDPINITNYEKKRYKNIRSDLLNEAKYTQKKGLRAFFRKLFHPKQKRFTNYFFEYLESHETDMETEDGWIEFLKEFSIFNISGEHCDNNSPYSKTVSDYIIKENIFIRGMRFFENHKSLFMIVIAFVIAIIAIIVYVSSPQNFSDILFKILDILI